MGSRRALITGITGQDGSHLADLLVQDGYEVHGALRPSRDPAAPLPRIEHLRGRLALHPCDLTDADSVRAMVAEVGPDEVYHLAADSIVGLSWEDPVRIGDLDGLGTVRVLEATRNEAPGARMCFASSSEVFGDPSEVPQSEDTPMRPCSPYGAAKAYGQHVVAMARERYDIHASSAILFNHEGPRRGRSFVTRRVTRGAAAIALGLEHRLTVGDLDARRDWGRAVDYVEGMRRIVAAPDPTDYVLATGVTHTVGELIEVAFSHAGVSVADHLEVDSSLVLSHTGLQLVGDPSRARKRLGWHPRTDFHALVAEMVDADLCELRGGGQTALA